MCDLLERHVGMVKFTFVTLAASVVLTGCTTTTATGTDGIITKTTKPVTVLWKDGFALADTLIKSKQQNKVSAPTKGN